MPPTLPVPPLPRPSLPLGTRGYQRKTTDEYIDELASFYEAVWLERRALREQVARLEEAVADREALAQEAERLRRDLGDQAKRQQVLAGALYAAERFAEAIKEEARRDAELTLKKARAKADDIVADAHRNRTRLRAEADRLEQLANHMRADLMTTLTSVLSDLEAGTSTNGDTGARIGGVRS